MKRSLVLIIFILVAIPAFCAVWYSPKADASIGAEFFHSSVAPEKIPLRTSLFVETDVLPVNFNSGRIGFGAGISFSFTTRSLSYGHSIIKPYLAYGPVLGLDLHISYAFTLSFKTRLMFSYMGPAYLDKFASVEVGIVPSFVLVSKNRFDLRILVPLTEVFRKDGFCLRSGVGVGINL